MTEAFRYDQTGEATEFIGNKVVDANLEMQRITVTLGSGLKSFADRYTNPATRLVISRKK